DGGVAQVAHGPYLSSGRLASNALASKRKGPALAASRADPWSSACSRRIGAGTQVLVAQGRFTHHSIGGSPLRFTRRRAAKAPCASAGDADELQMLVRRQRLLDGDPDA